MFYSKCDSLYFQCLTPAYLPLRCASGSCGHIQSGEPSLCPEPCSHHDQCASCLATPGCGWCALGGMNGLGVCMEGGLMAPLHGACTMGNITMATEALSGRVLVIIVVMILSFYKYCQLSYFYAIIYLYHYSIMLTYFFYVSVKCYHIFMQDVSRKFCLTNSILLLPKHIYFVNKNVRTHTQLHTHTYPYKKS